MERNRMKFKYILPENAKGLKAIVNSAFRAEQTARVKVQIALVAIAFHAWKHGDWTEATRLCENIKTGKASAIRWCQEFIGLELVPVIKDGKELKEKTFGNWKGAKYVQEKFEEAKEIMYWEFEPPSQFKGYDINDVIRAALKRRHTLMTKMESGQIDDDDKAKITTEISDDTFRMLVAAAGQNGLLDVLKEQQGLAVNDDQQEQVA